jgi:antitoxin component YwqK of YwqJK toxin-antitoxin module
MNFKRNLYLMALAGAMTFQSCKDTQQEFYDVESGSRTLKKECQIGFFSKELDGKCTHFSKDGQKIMIETYKKGKLNGEVTHFKDGKVSHIENYKDGILNGKSIGYHNNGQVWLETNYVDEKIHGKHTTYFDSGQIKEDFNYKHGKKDGDQKAYHRPDLLWYHSTYNDGCLENIHEVRDIKGNKLNHGDYKNGTGMIVNYYEDGTKKYMGKVENYVQIGKWSLLSKKGNIITSDQFKQGKNEPCEMIRIDY